MTVYSVVLRHPDLPTPQVAASDLSREAAERMAAAVASAWDLDDPMAPVVSVEQEVLV